jgi:hypothetical protein
MEMTKNTLNRCARTSLGLIRIVNGAVGLVAPKLFISRFDPDHQPSPAAIYAFRLFGVRTVLIGLDLLGDGPHVRRAVTAAPLVHGSDVATVVALGAQGAIPPRTARVTTAISAVNLLLALVAAATPRRQG